MFSADGLLKKFVVELSAGQALFTQGDRGNTMYIVLEGTMQLKQKTGTAERVVASLGPGEVFGEKAISVSVPYKRTASAIAVTDCKMLEFDAQRLKQLQSKQPEFALKMLSLVIDRLDRANQLIGILQLSDPLEKVVHYLAHYCEYYARYNQGQKEVHLDAASISPQLHVDAEVINQVIEELVSNQILKKTDQHYLVINEEAIIAHLSSLRERIAA